MISMMMFVLSLFAGKQIQERPIDYVHHDTYSVAALADGMAYYQSQAIQKCWQDGASSCSSGPVELTNRVGSQATSAYGVSYETITDGVNYIATTLASKGMVAGRTHQESNVNSGVFSALKNMTAGSSTVGYYDQTIGGVVLPDKDNAVVSINFTSLPVQGQPVILATIATFSPPPQLASIAGGSYSPVVPLSPPITPSPSSEPIAMVSPPAAVSPPQSVSPTYTPPATAVISPISPWAPSPVPPPPPPPVPPPPPPPPPVPPAPPPVVYPDNMPTIHTAFPPSRVTGVSPLELAYPLAKMQDLTLTYPCIRLMTAQAGYMTTVVGYNENVIIDKTGGVSADTIRSYCDSGASSSYTKWITVYAGYTNYPDLISVGQTYLDAYNAYYGTSYAFTDAAYSLGVSLGNNYRAVYGHYP